MNELKQLFLDQSPRDQLMLSVGGLVVLVYILLFLVLFPMQNDLAKKQKRNESALAEQQRVYELAGQVLAKQQGGSDGSTDQSLNSLLNQSLREFGLAMEQFQPTGNAARVRLATSEFNKVLAWLHEMEIKQGVLIKDLSVTADKNPGAVLVNLQLVRGE